MAIPLKRNYKVKYITNHADYSFNDGIYYNQGKFVVEAADVNESIAIVKKKLDGFLSPEANVYITYVKELV